MITSLGTLYDKGENTPHLEEYSILRIIRHRGEEHQSGFTLKSGNTCNADTECIISYVRSTDSKSRMTGLGKSAVGTEGMLSIKGTTPAWADGILASAGTMPIPEDGAPALSDTMSTKAGGKPQMSSELATLGGGENQHSTSPCQQRLTGNRDPIICRRWQDGLHSQVLCHG